MTAYGQKRPVVSGAQIVDNLARVPSHSLQLISLAALKQERLVPTVLEAPESNHAGGLVVKA